MCIHFIFYTFEKIWNAKILHIFIWICSENTGETPAPTSSPTLDGCDFDIDAYLEQCYCDNTLSSAVKANENYLNNDNYNNNYDNNAINEIRMLMYFSTVLSIFTFIGFIVYVIIQNKNNKKYYMHLKNNNDVIDCIDNDLNENKALNH